MSVWGDHQPPPTPTHKTSNPKVLHRPFQDCGLPLPRRRQDQQNNCPCRHPGQRHWPVLPILEGGRCVCPFVSGLHRLRWQHWVFLLGPGGQNLHPTSLPTLLPQVSNMSTAFILFKEIIVYCLVSVVPTPHAQAAPTLLTSLLPNKMPTTASN
jgi:hypothetical protein